MDTVAETTYSARLATLRSARDRVQAAKEHLERVPVNSKTRKATRRVLVTYGIHAVVSLGAPESLGITLFLGFLVDLARFALTLLGPLVGMRGKWTELFVLKFWDGDLLDKFDVILVLLEVMVAVIAAVCVVLLIGMVGYQTVQHPAFQVFSQFFL